MTTNSTQPDKEPTILMPESMPSVRKSPKKGSFLVKAVCTVAVLCICAGALWYWWSGQPLKLESEVFTSGEIWVRSDREGEVGEVFVKPGQRVVADEPLLRFRLTGSEILRDEDVVHLALFEGDATAGTIENFVRELREIEKAAETEKQKRSSELSRATYERRRLEAGVGAGKVSRDQWEEAGKVEAAAETAYKAAAKHFEDASRLRAQSLARLEATARDVKSMNINERRSMASMYRKKIEQSDNAVKNLLLRSPIKGVVLKSHASPGMKVYPSLQLLALAPEDRVVFSCRAFVSPETAKKIKLGTYCEVTLSDTVPPYSGTVRAIRDVRNQATQVGRENSFAVFMEFSGKYEELAQNLRIGMPLTVSVFGKDVSKSK